MNRRVFLKNAALTSVPLVIPDIFKPLHAKSNRKLVMVHLAGGNDGFNTIIPYTDRQYYKARPNIAVAPDEVIRLNNEFGFHPALESLKPHFDKGYMLVINQVGFDCAENSHYIAARLWENILPGSDNQSSWLDKYLVETSSGSQGKVRAEETRHCTGDNFAGGLKEISHQMCTEPDKQIFRISMDGFDTHQFQKYKHAGLLASYANGMAAFLNDLEASDQLQHTLIITWSEFGRELKENNKKGTDHGNINSLLIYSGLLQSTGVRQPAGNRRIDFKEVYATVLRRWFNVPPGLIFPKHSGVMDWI